MGYKSSAKVRLGRVRREIRANQARDHRELKGAIIGRPVRLLSEVGVNAQLLRQVPDDIRYRRQGQIALVYLFRQELREHQNKTFFNTTHITQALEKAPQSVHDEAMISRAELQIVEPAYMVTASGLKQYWLIAHALKASRPNSERAIDMKREELSIANYLFNEANDFTGDPNIWLGALVAPSVSAAQEALEPLEDIIAPQFEARAVAIVPWHD